MKNRVVFVDRDGVLNRLFDGDYVRCWDEFEFLPRVTEALQRLHAEGIPVVVITNQSCINRGVVPAADIEKIHARMCRAVERAGGRIEAIYCCPHRPDESCDCRKPEPGLLQRAISEMGVDPAHSFLIGDSASDVLAGRRAGCQTCFVRSGRGDVELDELRRQGSLPNYIVSDLYEAVEAILQAWPGSGPGSGPVAAVSGASRHVRS